MSDYNLVGIGASKLPNWHWWPAAVKCLLLPNADLVSDSCQTDAGSPECILPKSSGCSRMHLTRYPLRLADWATVMALTEKWMKALPVAARRFWVLTWFL